jgi:hypothetical protein
MAIVFARVKGVQALAFIETAGDVRRRFVGWAEPDKVRWTLAQHYPWIEQAYATAYSEFLAFGNYIVSDRGTIGQDYQPNDPRPMIDFIKQFLMHTQSGDAEPLVPVERDEWVLVDETRHTYEHSPWINSEQLEMMLGKNLHGSSIRLNEFSAKSPKERLRILLAVPERFRAVVGDDQRFEYLVNQDLLLDEIVTTMSAEN